MPDITPEESRELKSRDLTPPMSDMNDRDRQAFEKWYTSSRDYSQESIAVIAEEAYAAAIAHARQQDAELLERCWAILNDHPCHLHPRGAELTGIRDLIADIAERKAGV